MGTVHRDHSNLVNIEKRLKGGRIGVRAHSNSPRKTAISTGGSIYPVEGKEKGVYAFVLAQLELAGSEKSNCLRPRPKKCGPFSVVSSRYLDRGRVLDRGDGRRLVNARVRDLCSGAQEKLTREGASMKRKLLMLAVLLSAALGLLAAT